MKLSLQPLLTVHWAVQAIKEIRLCNNRISAGGFRALSQMLHRNRAIVVLDVRGNICQRGFSCVHHHMGNFPDAEAVDELQRLLKQNQVR